jgi:hypothetical protein
MKLIYLSIITCGLILMGCKKTETPVPIGKTFTVNASSTTQWAYFSFAKGDTVEVNRPDTSIAWDLAFNQSNIRTNSGLSGKGTGGAYNSGKVGTNGFPQLKLVSNTATFTKDDSIFVYDERGNQVKIIGNNIFNGITNNWYDYNSTSHVLTSKNQVYIIRTATNKYAKFLISSFYNPKNPSITTGLGYYTFTYFYQPNGSDTLQ